MKNTAVQLCMFFLQIIIKTLPELELEELILRIFVVHYLFDSLRADV